MAYEENRARNRGVMNVWMKHDMNQNYESPRPRSRVGCSMEAEENMNRHRGTLVLGEPKPGCYTARVPRVHGQEAEDLFRKSQGTMGNLMNLEANRGFVSARPQPRVKEEASEIADKNCNGLMKTILNSRENMNYATPRPEARVKPEASYAAERNKGSMNKILDSKENRSYYNPRNAPRVKPEAEGNALRNSGTMDKFMDMTRPRPPTPREMRVKPEAKEIYDKNRGTLTNCYYTFGKVNVSNTTAPKVKGEGQSIAHVGVNGTCKFLFEKYGQLPRDPRNAPRVKSEARRYAKQGQGSIGDMLGTKGMRGKTR